MGRNARYGKYGNAKRKQRVHVQKSIPMQGRDILRLEEHFKIAPKHPGMGRK